MKPFVFLLLAAALGCGGTVDGIDDTTQDGAVGEAGKDAHPTDGKHDGQSDGPPIKDGFSEYKDPGCPDVAIPPPDLQCDPYAPPPGGCEGGEACYPYVQYPSSKCSPEVYGAICQPAGSGTQGSACGGQQECSGGFICVISGSGVQCVELCKLNTINSCKDGLVCQPVDIPGYGGCL